MPPSPLRRSTRIIARRNSESSEPDAPATPIRNARSRRRSMSQETVISEASKVAKESLDVVLEEADVDSAKRNDTGRQRYRITNFVSDKGISSPQVRKQ